MLDMARAVYKRRENRRDGEMGEGNLVIREGKPLSWDRSGNLR